tara:strand:+ start:133 stop:873 length:741 start_codon:yes stop_codon:yes gene_type:complete
MGLAPDISQVYPKTGLTTDVSFGAPYYVSEGSCFFDGDSGSLTIPDGSATGLDGYFSGDGTITCWAYANGPGEGTFGRFIATANTGANGFVYFLNGAATDNKVTISLTVFFSGGGTTWSTTNKELELGQWNHIALTYNGSNTSNQPTIYINGSSVAIGTQTPSGTITSDNEGAKVIGNSSGDDRTFDGYICNFGLWKGTALTQAQVKQVMAATSYAAVQAVAQPTAYYLLSTDGNDSTGNFNGTLG